MIDALELNYRLMEAQGGSTTNDKRIKMRTAKLDTASRMLQRGYSVQDVSYYNDMSIDAVLAEKAKLERQDEEVQKYLTALRFPEKGNVFTIYQK